MILKITTIFSLFFIAPPSSVDGSFHVVESSQAVKDYTTGDWSIQLTCSALKDPGVPPVTGLVWVVCLF